LLLILVIVFSAIFASAQKTDAKDNYAASIAKFHQEKEADLRKPDGWLSVSGLFWLKEGNNIFYLENDELTNVESDLKNWSPHENALYFRLSRNSLSMNSESTLKVLINGKSFKVSPWIGLSEGMHIPLKVQSASSSPDILTYKSYTMFVIQRGDKFGLRVKNSEAAARKNFKGMVWYDVEKKFRVEAKYIPYAEPKTLQVPTMINIPAAMQNPGRVEFKFDGKLYSLDAVIEETPPKELFFIFKDLTATHGTYGAGRFLYTSLPSNGISKEGTVMLDFNKSENPPCAVTAFATCPIPPKQNRLEVAIPAGEKYAGDH